MNTHHCPSNAVAEVQKYGLTRAVGGTGDLAGDLAKKNVCVVLAKVLVGIAALARETVRVVALARVLVLAAPLAR